MEKSGSPRSGTLVKAMTCWRKITAVATPITNVAQSHCGFDGQSNTKVEARIGLRFSGPRGADAKWTTPRTQHTTRAAMATDAPDAAARWNGPTLHSTPPTT